LKRVEGVLAPAGRRRSRSDHRSRQAHMRPPSDRKSVRPSWLLSDSAVAAATSHQRRAVWHPHRIAEQYLRGLRRSGRPQRRSVQVDQ
jgi:hypothetical protein